MINALRQKFQTPVTNQEHANRIKDRIADFITEFESSQEQGWRTWHDSDGESSELGILCVNAGATLSRTAQNVSSITDYKNDQRPAEWRQESEEIFGAMHIHIWSLRNAMEGAPDLSTTEFEARFDQLPEEARNEIEQWIEDMQEKNIQTCRDVDEELQRRLDVTPAVLNTIYPVSWKQRETADSLTKRDVERKLGEIEATIGTTTGYIEGCPEEVPSTGATEGRPADGDGFESCSDEAVGEQS